MPRKPDIAKTLERSAQRSPGGLLLESWCSGNQHTIDTLAGVLEVPGAHLWRIVRGTRHPTVQLGLRMMALTGIPLRVWQDRHPRGLPLEKGTLPEELTPVLKRKAQR